MLDNCIYCGIIELDLRGDNEMRTIRNPEKWIGRKPTGMNWEQHRRVIDNCDNCQRLYNPDDLHALLYPTSAADFALQKAVRVEEAQGFCPDCLAEIEADADAIDPNWRHRHGLVA